MPMGKTPNVGDTVFFADSHAPDGWKAKESYSDQAMKALTAKQNPAALTDGKCSFTQQVTFLPDYYQSRGDDYLSRQYLYDNAQIAGTLPEALKVISTSTDSKDLEMVSATYVVKGVPEKTGKDATVTPDSFRAIAVRALDKSLNNGYDVPAGQRGPYESDAAKGLPTIVLIEDCPSQKDFKADQWESLVKSSKVNLTQPAPSEPAPSATPSTPPQPSNTSADPASSADSASPSSSNTP